MPTNKKYSFAALLKEFNEIHITTYALTLVSNCVLVRNCKNGAFHVLFNEIGRITRDKLTLGTFTRSYVSFVFPVSKFKDMILEKEQDKPTTKIKVWPSNKIRYAYLESNYASQKGNLGKSCMRLKEMQKALNFYVKNNVKIVVVIDDKNKIHARALLWDNVKSTKLKKPFIYLDRVYARSDTLLSLFYDLASTNKWKRYPSTTVNDMDDSYYKEGIDAIGMCYIPYNDTFRFLYLKDNLLTSSAGIISVKNSDSYVTLNVHDNSAYYPQLDPNRVREALTNKYVSKKDCTRIKRYNGYVLKKNIVSVDGDYYSKHDNKIMESKLDGFMLAENSVNEFITNEVIDKTKAIKSVKYGGYIHKSNIVNIKGVLYHAKDTDIVYYEGTWYHVSQCFINYDRKKANEELAAISYLEPSPRYVLRETVTRKGSLVPKECAIIAYNLIYSPISDSIEYQEVYRRYKDGLIRLITGELIINSSENREHLKKFNNKWYIKKDFKLHNKKQLTLFGD